MIGKPGQVATALAAQCRRDETHGLCLFQRGDHVRAFARRGNSNDDITSAPKRLYLARKNPVKTKVVARSGESRRVCGQSDRSNRSTTAFEAIGQFRREVLGVGCAAAIAKEQELAAGTNRF